MGFLYWGPHYHPLIRSSNPLIPSNARPPSHQELLVPGGRLCITMFSPLANISGSNCPVADFYRQSYAERESAGCKWPGEEMGTILKRSHKKRWFLEVLGIWMMCFWIRFNIQMREIGKFWVLLSACLWRKVWSIFTGMEGEVSWICCKAVPGRVAIVANSDWPLQQPNLTPPIELLGSTYGCFLKWRYPQNTPKWSFLVGKPMVAGYHHFRKPPYKWLGWPYFSTGMVTNQSLTGHQLEEIDSRTAGPLADLDEQWKNAWLFRIYRGWHPTQLYGDY